MQEELLRLLAGRPGHFQMESGYHSERWFDLGHLLAQRERLRPFVSELARQLKAHPVEMVCGPVVGGAQLAELIGGELGLPAVSAERFETTAPGLFPVRYKVAAAHRNLVRGKAIAIVDDAISAGSAVRGTYADLVAWGARPIVLGALIIFGARAASFAAEHALALESVAQMRFGMWTAAECPLCRAGAPLHKVSDAP